MKIYNGSDYLVKQKNEYNITKNRFAKISCILPIISIPILYISGISLYKNPDSAYYSIVFLLSLVGTGLFFRNAVTSKLAGIKELHFKKGISSEEELEKTLSEFLGDGFSYFKNIQIPGTKHGDIDAVLIGYSGVWVIENKNYSGTHTFYNGIWKRNNKTIYNNPIKQLRTNWKFVKEYLDSKNIDVPIFYRLYWGGNGNLQIEENIRNHIWYKNSKEWIRKDILSRFMINKANIESAKQIFVLLST